jgi:probable F420-dependent oxidoreductase
MTIQLGTYGIWQRVSEANPETARTVEALGYGSLWVGGSPGGDLGEIEAILADTDALSVATGIVNMWRDDADAIARSYHRINEQFPGRFLLGVGIGHPEATSEYRKPYETMVAYLDHLDAAGVPQEHMILAALGPKALRLAADRTLGSHPYFTTPRHTRMAREIVGEGPVLAVCQTVVIDSDRARARNVARRFASRYLALTNYRNSLLREGWAREDLDDGGSDALIDDVVLTGDASAVAAGIKAHIESGADNVNIQALGDHPEESYLAMAEELEPETSGS